MAENTQKLTDRERAERYKMALQAIFHTAGSAPFQAIKEICAIAISEGEE